MATTHRAVGRTKGQADKIVIPAIPDIWRSFIQDRTWVTEEGLKKDGWLSVVEAVKLMRCHPDTLRKRHKKMRLEKKTFNVHLSGNSKKSNHLFYRPILDQA